MNDSKNIVYLLGAGASFNSIPILNHFGEAMVSVAKAAYGTIDKSKFPKISDEINANSVVNLINKWGARSLDYDTVDTLAFALAKNNKMVDLSELKLAVNLFLTLWQETDNEELKSRNFPHIVDRRYMSLLKSLLKVNNGVWSMFPNIHFVSWNYDLQLQKAFSRFCMGNIEPYEIHKYLKFRITDKPDDLNIYHLNGYSGHHMRGSSTENVREIPFFSTIESSDFGYVLDQLAIVYNAYKLGNVNINNHLKYAFEPDSLKSGIIQGAQKHFREADAVVVIGYSFPEFNHSIDNLLFSNLKIKDKINIYFQTPDFDKYYNRLKRLADYENMIIHKHVHVDQFITPNDIY